MALAAGTSINQYKIISRLGSGGMGEVYLAQDMRLGRRVALKLLYENVRRDDDWVRRFEQEARATSSLNHPNIITIYEVGQSDGSHFISAEFIDGRTLREHLKQNVLTLREVLDIAIQVATALSTAHAAGIAHRDIKPENVMLRGDGYVKVVDFGLAKLIEKRLLGLPDSDPDAETQRQSEPFVNTNPGAVMGTVSYMSPEQARGAHVDTRTDIFSLGVLLYEMLTGRLPFEGSTTSEVIVSIIEKRPKPITRFAPDVPVEMIRIVTKALSKKRDERYQTVQDMLIDLKRLRRGLELEEETDETAVEAEPPPARPQSDGRVRLPQPQPGAGTGEASEASTASSAEYIVRGLKRHKLAALVAAGVIAAALAAYFYYRAVRPIDSIAVVPVHGGASETEDEQRGDQITKQLIKGLSQLSPDLRVAPFHSVHQLKGKSPGEVGRELDVRAVLTVEARRSGDNLTISTELVDVRDNRHLWGDSPSVKFSDTTLTAQSIIASVSDRLGLQLSAADQKKKEAAALYMKARHAWNQRTPEDIKSAVNYFNDALKQEPGYAPAQAGLADAHNMLATYGVAAPRDAFPKARAAAEAALKIDNRLAEAHAALAYAKFRGDWDWPGAEAAFNEAIRLNPDYASARQWYASYLAAMSRFDEAEKETSRAQERDKNSLVIQSHLGLMYFFARRYDDAISVCRKAVEMNKDFFIARRYLGLAYAQKGMYKEAVAEYEKVLEASKGSPLMRAEYASALALDGETEKARAELDNLLGMIERRERYISAYHIATVYVALKDRDNSIRWLKQAFSEGADWMVYLNVDPRFEALRSDPEFTDLLRQLGFKTRRSSSLTGGRPA